MSPSRNSEWHALYGGHQFYDIDLADTIINRKGAIKQCAEMPMYAIPPGLIGSPDEFDNPEEVSVVDAVPHFSPFSR